MNQAARQTASTLGKALAISLALHALLLLQEAAPPDGAASSGTTGQAPPLDARLHSASGPIEASKAVEAPKRAKRMPANVSATALAHSTPAPVTVSSTTPARVEPQRTNAQPLPTDASFASTGVGRNESIDDGATRDTEGLRQYRIDLAVATRRFRDYPAAARNAGIGGVAGVRLAFAAAGLAPTAELDSSSGNGLLDAAAVAMLGNAARATPLPARLRGRPFAMVIPVEFDPRAD